LAGCSVLVVLHSKLWWQDGPVVWAHFWWDRLVVAIRRQACCTALGVLVHCH
jgi:hypothetical protein